MFVIQTIRLYMIKSIFQIIGLVCISNYRICLTLDKSILPCSYPMSARLLYKSALLMKYNSSFQYNYYCFIIFFRTHT